nr:uncharacterized protein LOC112941328 [Solanum lycopersicum]
MNAYGRRVSSPTQAFYIILFPSGLLTELTIRLNSKRRRLEDPAELASSSTNPCNKNEVQSPTTPDPMVESIYKQIRNFKPNNTGNSIVLHQREPAKTAGAWWTSLSFFTSSAHRLLEPFVCSLSLKHEMN